MLFNSLPFLVFLPVCFLVYWLLGGRRWRLQNAFLIVASYVFYGWWDARFLVLIFVSSLADYLIGLRLHRTADSRNRRLLLIASLVVNLGILGFFKYFNFFIDSTAELLTLFGLQPNLPTLRIILPVGISFYTFQTLSYTLDIYRREMEPTDDPVAFFAFVSFFPQLVAGPIERARSLLPQFYGPRTFDQAAARDGLRQMLWGFVKKMVVADTMAPLVQEIFADAARLDGVTLFLGAFFFALQIYCDFSGYSDIAIGTARLFGFQLSRNFAYPYFSRDIAEFWHRWHISLSTWFRDYVFIPLGGSRADRNRRILNILVTFTVSGLWHGANWTFVVWGALNGAYYIPLMLTDRLGRNRVKEISGIGDYAAMAGTFGITLVAWVFFRADSLTAAGAYLWRAARYPWLGLGYGQFLEPVLIAVFPLVVEWFARDRQHGLEIGSLPGPLRWGIYMTMAAGIMVCGRFGSTEFIYFQF